MATHLGTRGYVSAIRRLKSGPFVLENAVSMAELERLSIENAASTLLLPLKSSLGSIPTLSLTQNESESLHLGKTIILNPNNKPLFNASPIFAEYNGMPVALVEAVDGVIRVLRGFRF
jgi:tRNA pseudouridine55 synthase